MKYVIALVLVLAAAPTLAGSVSFDLPRLTFPEPTPASSTATLSTSNVHTVETPRN